MPGGVFLLRAEIFAGSLLPEWQRIDGRVKKYSALEEIGLNTYVHIKI